MYPNLITISSST